MELLAEMMKDGKTQTNFGRHHEKLSCLEEAVTEAGFEEHNALIIGAGLDVPHFSYWLEGTRLQNNPDLQRPYSWEVIELAAILERLGKPWTITVVDDTLGVCAAVDQQTTLVIDDFYSLKDPCMTDYAKGFLAAIGIRGNDDAEMEAINKALESKGVGNRLSVFRKFEIPSHIKERIQVVQGSVASLGKRLPTGHNVATCLNVMMYLPHGFEHIAAQSVSEVVAERGVVLSDFELPGFRQTRVFQEENQVYGDCGGSYTQITMRYISVKKPEVKQASAARVLQLA